MTRYILCIIALPLLLSAAPVLTPEIERHVARLDHEDHSVRIAATEALGRLGSTAAPATSALLRRLEDPHVVVRGHAAWALGKIGSPTPEVIRALIQRVSLPTEEWPVRHNATLSLSWFGTAAVPQLKSLLTAEDAMTRGYAVDALLRMGTDAPPSEELLPVVADLLRSPILAPRGLAANLAFGFGAAGAPLIPALVELLKDSDASVRASALRALGQLGPLAVEAIPSLVRLLAEDKETWVRIGSAHALGFIGPGNPASIPALVAALGDSKERVAAYAQQALVRFGPAAVPALTEALAASQKRVRMFAADGLAEMGALPGADLDTTSLRLIAALAKDEAWEVRARAATALGALGPDARRIAALENGLQDEHEIVRINASNALARANPTAATPAISQPLPTSSL